MRSSRSSCAAKSPADTCLAPCPIRFFAGQEDGSFAAPGRTHPRTQKKPGAEIQLPASNKSTHTLRIEAAQLGGLGNVTAACFPNEHRLMLLDGASWHTAAALEVRLTLHLQPLPPYSLELNPVKYLGDHVRENYIGNRAFRSLDGVVEHLCAGLHYLHQHREIVRSMTCFDWSTTLSFDCELVSLIPGIKSNIWVKIGAWGEGGPSSDR